MFIPLHDANRLKHIELQYVTLGLIGLNVLVFVVVNLVLTVPAQEAAVLSLGFIPGVAHGIYVLPAGYPAVPEGVPFVTYAFLHNDIIHLGGNMLFLWVFGDNVEDALGHLRYLAFYLMCGAAGAFVHGFVLPESDAPLIGASGAISGVIGAYLVLHPKVRVWILAFGRIPLRLPAAIPLGLWIVFQLAALFLSLEDDVSWAAHVGGIAAGVVLVVVMRRREVPLFDRTVLPPKALVVEGSRHSARQKERRDIH